MCSIIASYDINKIKELAKLNEYRGQHSHSFFVYDFITNEFVYTHKSLGKLNVDVHKEFKNKYYIVHQQAPTGIQKDSSIHPAIVDDNLLWHNGIIKSDCVDELKIKLQCSSDWDTLLLLQDLIKNKKPKNIDGTFSCLWYNGENIIVFRNEISPLFMDKEMNLSSTQFDGSKLLDENIMFCFNLNRKEVNSINKFETIENPYFFI